MKSQDILELIKKRLVDETKYQGNTEPNSKTITASEFGSDILQIYYKQKYGVIEKEEFGQNTIGTLLHLAIQRILYDDFEIELSIEKPFDNGWKLSGSIDLMNNEWIIDIKTTKSYTIENVLKDKNHQYRWQLAVYKYLANNVFKTDFKTGILFVLKDGGYNISKNIDILSLDLIEIDVSYLDVEKRFYEIIDKINALEKLSDDEIKNIHCEDLWWRKSKGRSEPIRCKKYCSYNDKCLWYKNFKKNPMQIDL